jgi:fluoroquinolone resistance protein
MERKYIEDREFIKTDFTEEGLPAGEYDNCRFVHCNFSNTNLSHICFGECAFNDCNLGMAKLGMTAFKDVRFISSKLLGLHFEHCDPFLFSVQFEDSILDLASFYKMKLKKIIFKNCSLQEVDFTEADLSGSVFNNCNLAKAVFENTFLEKADFRNSYNYSINPELNRVKKARFSMPGVIGLLDKYDIEIE